MVRVNLSAIVSSWLYNADNLVARETAPSGPRSMPFFSGNDVNCWCHKKALRSNNKKRKHDYYQHCGLFTIMRRKRKRKFPSPTFSFPQICFLSKLISPKRWKTFSFRLQRDTEFISVASIYSSHAEINVDALPLRCLLL